MIPEDAEGEYPALIVWTIRDGVVTALVQWTEPPSEVWGGSEGRWAVQLPEFNPYRNTRRYPFR